MIHRILAALAVGVLAVGVSSSPVFANPGPGDSHACAPGQQGNQDPAFKPGACDNK